MAAIINLRHLEEGPLFLKGEVSPKDLDLEDVQDELIKVTEPLHFDVEVTEGEGGILVSGKVWVNLDCECVRCLKACKYPVVMDPYHAFLATEGEEAVTVANDSVDLGQVFREDTLLAFPQHPLCSEDCAGLPGASGPKTADADDSSQSQKGAAAWGALDRLKFN